MVVVVVDELYGELRWFSAWRLLLSSLCVMAQQQSAVERFQAHAG